MAPKEEAGGADRCTVAAWTMTKNSSGRPPLVASANSSKVGERSDPKKPLTLERPRLFLGRQIIRSSLATG